VTVTAAALGGVPAAKPETTPGTNRLLPTELTIMPQITLDMGDAAELAEMLTFLASWLSGSQKQILADSFAAFVGHPAYNTDALHADLHRFASSSAPATAKNSSASQRRDRQRRRGALT
jgi:hypothetical protein